MNIYKMLVQTKFEKEFFISAHNEENAIKIAEALIIPPYIYSENNIKKNSYTIISAQEVK